MVLGLKPAPRGAAPASPEEPPAPPLGATIKSVVVAAAVLETLAAAPAPMRLTEIARELGEAKARIHRHLATLRRLGLVEQERSSDRYRLGWKLLHLGQAAESQLDLRRLAVPYMERLRDLSHQTVVLSLPADGEAMVAAVVEGPNLVTISVRQGALLPAHASAQGRIALAFAPPELQRRILSRRLAAPTPRTITDPAVLRARLAAIRERFYEVAPGETLLGISTLAAPILDRDDRLVGAVAIVGTDHHIPDPADEAQLRLVQACAAAISDRLDSRAWRGRAVPMREAFQLG